jgi:hypothetical protein
MILAGIDIGTNSLRLLVADAGRDSLREIVSDRKVTRLGQDLDRRGMLTREAEDRALDALGEGFRACHRTLAAALPTHAAGDHRPGDRDRHTRRQLDGATPGPRQAARRHPTMGAGAARA